MSTTGFTIIDLIILIVYLLAVLVAGIYFSKKEMKGKSSLKEMVRFLGMLLGIHFCHNAQSDFLLGTRW